MYIYITYIPHTYTRLHMCTIAHILKNLFAHCTFPVRTFCIIMVLVAVSCHKLAFFFPQVWQEGTAELHMAGLYHNVQATGFCFWPQFFFCTISLPTTLPYHIHIYKWWLAKETTHRTVYFWWHSTNLPTLCRRTGDPKDSFNPCGRGGLETHLRPRKFHRKKKGAPGQPVFQTTSTRTTNQSTISVQEIIPIRVVQVDEHDINGIL